MPDIIFNLRYRYTQYTTRKLNEIEKKKQIDTKKANEYYDRDEACDKTISTDKAFNYYDYRIGSMGGFNDKGPVNAKITQAECDHYRPEIVYQGVFSFKREFALQSGILEKKDMEKLIRKSMTNVIRQLNLDPENVVWNAAYHTNTDNPHCHFMMYEKKLTRKKLLLSKTKMERVRSEVLSNTNLNIQLYFSKDQQFTELINVVDQLDEIGDLRKYLTDSVYRKSSKYNRKMVEKLIDLEKRLPRSGSMKYNSKNIRPFHNDIREIIQDILSDDKVKPFYDQYDDLIKELSETFKKNYGDGTQPYKTKEGIKIGVGGGKKMQDEYYRKEMYKLESRLANMMLQNILKAREDVDASLASLADASVADRDTAYSEERKSKNKKNKERYRKKKRGTKNYYKRNLRSRSNIMTYGAMNEIAKSIQTVYYASLREKQKIREVTQRAQENSLIR
ncbi:relaxase MobL [Faecalicoccus pleomorphus]|uniref:relaxase MobL n=1 Tax=Faecalicoccus pleomorphus TaxID=1323 RepID=UPI0026EBEDD5|nr:relaxase MobL [Faecalicoccus pleomorphus]